MLLHFTLLLIPITAISLNNLKSNCNCQPSSLCASSVLCANGSFDNNNDRKISKKIQLGKLKAKKQISNEEVPTAHVHSRRRSRILKRSTKQGSAEDDSDLIMSSRRDVTTNQRARTQGISTKQIIDKSTLSKIMKSRPRMDIKCNSEELRKVMLESISDNSSASKRTVNKRAEAKFGGSIDVICSKDHFSYVYSSNLYCEATKGNVTCIAFRQSHS